MSGHGAILRHRPAPLHRAQVPLDNREVVALGLRPGNWVIDTRNILDSETVTLLLRASPELLGRVRAALLREHLASRSENLQEVPCP
jgi:hypothetical protein